MRKQGARIAHILQANMYMGAQGWLWISSAVCLWLLVSYAECSSRKPILKKPRGSTGTGCYFIVLEEKTTEEEMQQVMTSISKLADGSRIYSIIKKVSKSFTVKLSPYSLEVVRRMPAVDYIEEEGYAVGVQASPEWHLDRLDQTLPQLDHKYWPIGEASGVDVYILDSGIEYDHEEFEYRAKYAGVDPTDEYNAEFPDIPSVRWYGRDCHGHGTHVASLCGGKTYGTAKKVTLYSVRVLGCNNAGPWSVVLSGIDFAVGMVERTRRPSVLSMSFSGDHYSVVNNAIHNALNNRGVHVVMAAGNGLKDACSRSPASTERAITVGGTRQGDGLYLLGPGTNFGRCVDIFAPGERVLGADWTCKNCSRFLSGTSMSTPLVSGLAAIRLGREPLLSADELKSKLVEESVKDAIDYEGMPEDMRAVTPNRLAAIQGSCGERNSPFGTSTITSPSFPNPYPPNLDCHWVIGGEDGLRIHLNIASLNLEPFHDVLRVFDGCCENQSSLLREFSGNLRQLSAIFSSSSNLMCLQLVTDGSISASGFNATYTKFYAGTDLVVPNPRIVPPPSATENARSKVTLKMSPRQARERIGNLMDQNYKLTWISSYRLGPSMEPYFDFVMSNSSAVDTISFVEIGYSLLNKTIQQMKEKGYYIKLLIDRIRGRNPSEPSYSVILEPRDPIYETRVYLRDAYEAYQLRLSSNTNAGFRIISHSFCSIHRHLEATSVYVRDKRVKYNIPVPDYPSLEVGTNLTFFEFTSNTLRLANQGFFPRSVEVFSQGTTTNSFFSAIYEERSMNSQGNWFRWSLNTTAARDMIEKETQDNWDVYITVGYTYLDNIEHFIEFRRKERYLV